MKAIDLSVPGWGSWAGAGIDPEEEAKKNKRQKARRHYMKNGRYYRRPLVIRPEDLAKTDDEKRQLTRQDANLSHVIISEKKDTKIAPFQVQHTFISQRSLLTFF